jgi:hypothetical protein
MDQRVRQLEASADSQRGEESRHARQVLKEIRRLESLLPRRPFLGRNVPKDRIPKPLKQQGVSNLFRNDLPGGWRFLHTVMEVDGEQAVVELRAMSHEEYDRLFGYEGI